MNPAVPMQDDPFDIDELADAATAKTIEAAARLLIGQYGAAAFLLASLSADERIAKRDQQEIASWLLIRAAVRRRLNAARGQYTAPRS